MRLYERFIEFFLRKHRYEIELDRVSEKRPKITINNTIRPIKVQKDDKVIMVVGDEDEILPKGVFERLKEDFRDVMDNEINEMIIPAVIKLYVVPKECKIELYRGDKIEKESDVLLR